jgi:translation initiation factor IF-3
VRINDRIRVREVRVIDENGQQLGIMAPAQAVAIARQRGLDLVEVSPTAVPPVCRITDYGKYQYTEQKRARQARKHQKTILVKEIKFRPKVDEHDYDFKKKHIERFIEDGDKVKAVIFFRGREIAHPEIGRRILERLISEVSEVAVAENMPRMEGNSMHVILGPRPGAGAPKKPAQSSTETRPPQAQQRRAPEPAQAAQPAAAPATADEKS